MAPGRMLRQRLLVLTLALFLGLLPALLRL